MAFLPDTGDLLITERSGTLHLRDAETGDRVAVAGVPEVVDAGQGGLGDVLPAPSYEEDGQVYLSWVEAGDGGTGAVVGRAVLDTDGDEPRLDGLEVVWRQTPKVDGDGHFSHRLAFSPDGEHLFVSSGDRQLGDPAQDTTNTLGTIVRLTPDGEPAPGNPLADQGGVSAEIWSWGHRNPLGLEHAPDGTLWSSEMGPEGGDELNVIEAGSNYGWPEASDGSDYGGGEIPDHAEGDGYAAPARSWNPEHLAGQPDGLRRRAVRGLAGRRVPRRAVGGGAGARRPRRPDRGRDRGLRHGGTRPRRRGRPRRRDLGARGRGRRPLLRLTPST